jgi:dihydropteroate synthase
MFTLNCKGKLLVVEKPVIMGIINTTPDSFYAGSRFAGVDAVVQQAEKMLQEGADILDIGGQSTRPDSQAVPLQEELDRVVGAIGAVHRQFPGAIISVDTFQSKVAAAAVRAGAAIINDVSGGSMDADMLPVAGRLQVPYICMHLKGTPATMQQHAVYENITREVLDYFIEKIETCRLAGINDIIIDPGFGFAKTIRHNFELLRNLAAFKMLQKPLLLGVSRKSTIYKTLGVTAAEALNGSTVLHTLGLANGANILRVHDVKEAKEAVTLYSQYALPSINLA